ncbi:MAG: HAD-IA family hydrolase [Actinomycetota bacterium]|nr:HAD-IA family hydrolase [Actinomycetota bacterium]
MLHVYYACVFLDIIPLMRKFKAALFDLDGTLLDTSEFIFQAFENTLSSHGIQPPSRHEISKLVGKPLEYCYKLLSGLANVDELCVEHRLFQANHLKLAKTYPGTGEVLQALKSADLKIATVTTRQRETSLRTLEITNLISYMDYVVALEDVENLKPHPEPVLKALNFLNVEPEGAVMVGDTDVDILAGKNAGTITVGATYGFRGMQIKDSDPDFIIDDIKEIIPLILATPEAIPDWQLLRD